MIRPILGAGGVSDERRFSHKFVFRDGKFDPLPGGGWIDGVKSRSPFTLPYENLEPGLLLGQVTTTNYWATSFIGATTAAITGAGTSFTVSAAQAAEIVRRIGATGTLTLMGPPAASGVGRQLTATYSAVNQTTGVVTITALGVNQVENINFNLASTAGNLQLTIQKPDGTFATTGNIAWNATDATYIASMNTALDTATGVVGGIVASAIPTVDTDLGLRLTYSGTGYAGLPWTRAQVALFPTTSTLAYYTPITTAVNGAFAAGSLVGDTDGSQIPKTCIPPGYGITVADGTNNPQVCPFPAIPIAGILSHAQLVPLVTDVGIKQWIEDRLSSTRGGKFVFSREFGGGT